MLLNDALILALAATAVTRVPLTTMALSRGSALSTLLRPLLVLLLWLLLLHLLLLHLWVRLLLLLHLRLLILHLGRLTIQMLRDTITIVIGILIPVWWQVRIGMRVLESIHLLVMLVLLLLCLQVLLVTGEVLLM